MSRLLIVALFVAWIPTAAFGQWTVATTQDDFTGETSSMAVGRGAELIIAVNCDEDGYSVIVDLIGRGIFANGDVDVRFDEGEVERYEFFDLNHTLIVTEELRPQVSTLIAGFREHSDLRIRVTKWRSEYVSDRLSLIGANDAIGTLRCNP